MRINHTLKRRQALVNKMWVTADATDLEILHALYTLLTTLADRT